jgi:hypothetical protein
MGFFLKNNMGSKRVLLDIAENLQSIYSEFHQFKQARSVKLIVASNEAIFVVFDKGLTVIT